jgi:Fe-S-cluster-containing dehydrogenase component
MDKIILKPGKCVACCICELACSHHHAKIFGRSLSSIAIYKAESTGQVEITIHDSEKNLRKACDRCENEEMPLCVKWCPVSALVVRKESR